MNQLIIVGAGALGREIHIVAQQAFAKITDLTLKGFIDANPSALYNTNIKLPILGDETEYKIEPDDRFVMALGDPVTRERVATILEARGAQFITVKHPSAVVAPGAELGDGCVLAQFSFVATGAQLMAHVMLNTYASVGHDAMINRSCILAPGAVVNGNAELGKSVLIGSNAVVTPGRRLGHRSRLGAGSVTYKNIGADCLGLGNPAKSNRLPRL